MLRLILPMIITAGLLAYGYQMPDDDNHDVQALNALVGRLSAPHSVKHGKRHPMTAEEAKAAIVYLYGDNGRMP